jgi:adenylate cyclase
MGAGDRAMLRWWWKGRETVRTAMSADFDHALMREVMRTELVRIKVLIAAVAILIIVVGTMYALDVDAVKRAWHGRLRPEHFLVVIGPFVLFELWVYRVISRHLELDRDIPAFRRYVGAFVETSMPTLALALHMDSLGRTQALGYVVPLGYFIFIILSTLRLDFWLSAFTGLVASAELFAMAMFYHPLGDSEPAPEFWFHAPRSLVVLGCGLLAGTVGQQLRRQFAASIRAATARDRVTSLFGQHVSPEVVERLLAEGSEAGSDIRRVAVMFVDFRGFTAAASLRSPQQVVDRLDGAFAVLVEILDRHAGIVNKFLGDGFLALFGAPLESPDAARHAVAAAREMLAAMDRINAASDWPLRIGIGIHFGEVVAGSIGSPRRKEYTVIGDTVNFASRLEALNKELGSQLLISSAVCEALGEASADAVSLGEVPIRGYERPVMVWQLG